MKINFHLIVEHNNNIIETKPLDMDYEHSMNLVIALRNVYKECDGWNVYIENMQGVATDYTSR